MRKSRNSDVYPVRWTKSNAKAPLLLHKIFKRTQKAEPCLDLVPLDKKQIQRKENWKPDNDMCFQQLNGYKLLVTRTMLYWKDSLSFFGQTFFFFLPNVLIGGEWFYPQHRLTSKWNITRLGHRFKNKVWCLCLMSTKTLQVLPNCWKMQCCCCCFFNAF